MMVAPVKNRLLNILLADDGSLNVRPAIQLLADLPHERESMVTALRVFTPIESAEFASIDADMTRTKNLLKSRHLHFRSELILGNPTEKIIDYAGQHSPDLIVMGARGTGALSGLLGSVAENVVHKGRWPVLIVRGPYNGLRRVLLVTDGSSLSHFTCEYLGTFPLPSETNVEVMYVIAPIRPTYLMEPAGIPLPMFTAEDVERLHNENEIRGKEILTRTSDELRQQGLEVKTMLLEGEATEQILRYVKEERIDMLVCGSRGAGNLAGWLLGSVSRELVLHASCSVMVVCNPISARS